MSRCLCCGKSLRTENEYGWHMSCIKNFFGTSKFPDIDVSKEDNPRLTLVNYPTGYILKPQTDEYIALPEMEFLVMEDFCQLDGRLTEDKYRGSYERCAKIILAYSAQKGLDKTELFIRVVFSFVVGNSDMHLKHFSLIETAEASGEYILSAAYDMLSTNVVIPDDKEQMALTISGKIAEKMIEERILLIACM